MVRSEASGTKKSKDHPRRKGNEIISFARELQGIKVEQERYLDLEALAHRNIQPMIDLMGWGRLVRIRGTYNLSMVTEFLAAAHPDDLKEGRGVTVRGKKVKFTPQSINEFFGTPCFANSYEHYYGFPFQNAPEANLTEDFVADIRAYPRGDWVPGSSKVNHKELTSELAFWNLFARHNIVPTQKNQELSDLNTKVLKSLARRDPFDLGEIMCQHLRIELLKQTWGRIIYPHLITALCERANVAAKSSDKYGESGNPIDDREYKIIIGGRDERAFAAEGIPRPTISKYKKRKMAEEARAKQEEELRQQQQSRPWVPYQTNLDPPVQPTRDEDQPLLLPPPDFQHTGSPYHDSGAHYQQAEQHSQSTPFSSDQFGTIMGTLSSMQAEQRAFFQQTTSTLQMHDQRMGRIETDFHDGRRAYQESVDMLRAQMESWNTFWQSGPQPYYPPHATSGPGEGSGKGKEPAYPDDTAE